MTSQYRRQFLASTAQAGIGAAMLGSGALVGSLAAEESGHRRPVAPLGKAEHCIMLWLPGGAAQIDTFDPKRKSKDGRKDPGSAYDSIPTAIPNVQVSEHLARTAAQLDKAILLRTLQHDVIDEHAAATNRMHTGRPVSGTIEYPSIGSVIAHLKGPGGEAVPRYVLMGYPTPSRGPGFLGADAGYLYLTKTDDGPSSLTPPGRVTARSYDRRRRLLDQVRAEADHRSRPLRGEYDTLVSQGFRLSGPEFMNVFRLEKEPGELRNAYGDEFGQRCLLARRLVQSGVRFVEVTSNLNFVNGTGWDTHQDGQEKQHLLIQSLDAALATLLDDLQRNRLLDKTLVVVCSEFGRPGGFDNGGGRNHHSRAFTAVLAGGGLRSGQVIGETNELAEEPVSRSISIPDFHATIYHALGIDHTNELYAESRPIPLTDGGHPIEELFG